MISVLKSKKKQCFNVFDACMLHILQLFCAKPPLLDSDSAALGWGFTEAFVGNILSSCCVPAMCRLCLYQIRALWALSCSTHWTSGILLWFWLTAWTIFLQAEAFSGCCPHCACKNAAVYCNKSADASEQVKCFLSACVFHFFLMLQSNAYNIWRQQYLKERQLMAR